MHIDAIENIVRLQNHEHRRAIDQFRRDEHQAPLGVLGVGVEHCNRVLDPLRDALPMLGREMVIDAPRDDLAFCQVQRQIAVPEQTQNVGAV